MAFARKLLQIVVDPRTDAVVHWSHSGESFVIEDIRVFIEEIVPRYFKLKKFESFCRQLNAYDFKKVRGGAWEFENANFKRDRPQLLANMRRKNPPRPRVHNNEAMVNQQENLQMDDLMMDVGIHAWVNNLADGAAEIGWEDPILFDGVHFDF